MLAREKACRNSYHSVFLVDISMWEAGRSADTSEGSTRDGPAQQAGNDFHEAHCKK